MIKSNHDKITKRSISDTFLRNMKKKAKKEADSQNT